MTRSSFVFVALALSTLVPGCPADDPSTNDGGSSDSSGGPSTSATTATTTTATTTTATTTSATTTETTESSSDDGPADSSSSDTRSSDSGSDSGSESSTGGVAPYEILDPTAEHFGMDYQGWAGAWWQWMYSLPATDHPVLDETGEFCTTGQGGDVFYLAGDFGGPPIMRTCTSPADAVIFIPVINSTWDNGGVPMDMWLTDQELQDGASGFIDGVSEASLEIDGDVYNMATLDDFRVGIYQSSYDVPVGDSIYTYLGYDFSGPVDPTFGDGYYAMIQFQPGDHELRIVATQPGADPVDTADDFTIDVTYMLTVE